MKKCKRCSTVYEDIPKNFSPMHGGYHNVCKLCCSTEARRRRAHPEDFGKGRKPKTHFKCGRCNLSVTLDDAPKHFYRSAKALFQNYCKTCSGIAIKETNSYKEIGLKRRQRYCKSRKDRINVFKQIFTEWCETGVFHVD